MELNVIWGDPNDTTPPVYQYAKFGGDDEWKPFIGTCWADCEIKGWPNQCEFLISLFKWNQEKHSLVYGCRPRT